MGRRAPTQDVLAELAASLGPGQLLGPADGLERYERAPFDGTRGAAAFVARPRTTAEVRAVLRWAHRHEVGLVAQGANTGLVHAGFPDGSGTTGVLSLELCRERFELDAVNRTLTVSAGWTLDALNERLAPEGLVLPIDLGSDPAVGGMVSTNTGGTRMIGYGDVRHRVLGLEVVLPDEGATVLEDLSGLRKDNTGVDLKQLFVGTGGQFGVVTAATFELAPRPAQVTTCLVGVTDDDAAFALLQAVEAGAGEFLTSYESMSRRVLEIRRRHTPGLRIGFADDDALPELAVLIELSSTTPAGGGLDLQELLAGLLADAAAAGHVVDAVFGDPVRLWELRHGLTEHTREGHSDWVDVSLPRSRIPEFRRRLQALVDADHPDWIPLDLGHYGDGGLHVGLLFPFHHGRPPDPGETAALRGAVYGLIAELDGTFSAEHGIGPYNQRYYHQLKDPVFQEISGRLKALFDPKGILGSFSLGPAPDK